MASEYKGLEFKTCLEVKWAAFFDLAGWSWWVNPVAINDWSPDFKVTFECDHSECGGEHTLLVSILPISKLEDIGDHPSLSNNYGVRNKKGEWLADGGAIFGNSPSITKWQIAHGSGGGIEDVYFRVPNADDLWKKAEKLAKK